MKENYAEKMFRKFKKSRQLSKKKKRNLINFYLEILNFL